MDSAEGHRAVAERALKTAITAPESMTKAQLRRVFRLFESGDKSIRLSASWTIGLLVSERPEALSGSVRSLVSLLKSEPESTHEDIYRSLAYIATYHPKLVRDAIEEIDLNEPEIERRVVRAIDGYQPPGDGSVTVTATSGVSEFETVITRDTGGKHAEKRQPTPRSSPGRPPEQPPPTPPAVEGRSDSFTPVKSLSSGSRVAHEQVRYTTTQGDHTAMRKSLRESVSTEFDAEFTDAARQWQAVDDHDAIVPVIGYGTIPTPWLVVEYQHGRRLSQRTGSLPRPEAAWIIDRVVDALCYAHGRGVIHGGLTPRNVVFTPSYDDELWAYPKVSNWGLSRLFRRFSDLPLGVPPAYAAPEQVAPETFGSVDAATDIYHLGGIVYEVLTGRPPFVDHPGMILRKVATELPSAPSEHNAALPSAVDTVVLKSLQKAKLSRHGSVHDFQAELSGALEAVQ